MTNKERYGQSFSVLMYPLNYNGFSRGCVGEHIAIDEGWNSNKGGQHVPIYAPADGKVVFIQEGWDNAQGSGSYGNYLTIYHGNIDGRETWTLHAHCLKGSITSRVKVGDMVAQGQEIAQMNNSGNSYGSHLHTEVRKDKNLRANRVDPTKCYHLFPHQEANANTLASYNILTYTPETTKPISSTPIRLNIGQASGGDIHTISKCLDELAIPYTVSDGYIVTDVAVSSGDQVKILRVTKPLGVACVEYAETVTDEIEQLRAELEQATRQIEAYAESTAKLTAQNAELEKALGNVNAKCNAMRKALSEINKLSA